MDLLDGLNPLQKQAVQAYEGPILVHAGPGSGKTRVITHRIAYLVNQHRVNPRYILAVTFSRKAAGEMQKRLEDLLKDSARHLTVGTFHSVCLAILRKEGVPGFGTSFDVVDDDAQTKLVKKCIARAGYELNGQDLRRIKSTISFAKCSMIDPDAIVPKQGERLDETAKTVYRLYQKELKALHALDYDDMLVHTHLLFKDNEDVLSRYQQRWRYILVDEFQDTSNLQYDIIRALGRESSNIFVVGDPDQSIYSWRQADIRNLASFKKDFPEALVIGMEENYRSTRNIVDVANALISRNTLRKDQKLRTAREKGARLALVKLADEMEEAKFTARELSRLAKERNIKFRSFAVLYRVNAQSRVLEEVFSTAGVPYRLVGGTPFYKRREIMDMLAWLRVVRNPADDSALIRIIKLSAKGIGPQTLSAMLELSQKENRRLYYVMEKSAAGAMLSLLPRMQRTLVRFHVLIEELRAGSQKINLPDLLNLVIEKTGYRKLLEQEEDGEERWENVQELVAMAGQFKHLSPLEALGALTDKISSLAETAELKQDADAVIFNTLHGAKGTEFPVVFIVGVEEGLLPHSKSLLEDDRLEEERRLCYVGITRAMDMVYLTHVEKRHAYGGEKYPTASRFIRELPADRIASRDFTAKPKLPAGDADAKVQEPDRMAMNLSVGDRIRHPKFGEGRIAEIIEDNRDYYVSMEFQGGIFRTFSYRLAGLVKLPD